MVMSAGTHLHAREPADREIEGLLQRLVASDCSLRRHDTWYTAQDASGHLRRKLAHLSTRRTIDSAELFVQLVGERSSQTGHPYAVRCPHQPELPSRTWLLGELAALRGGSE